jgi:TIR domain
MVREKQQFELANNLEHYLAALSKVYQHDGQGLKLEILVNATIRIETNRTFEEWDGMDVFGHALHLTLPQAIYLNCIKWKAKLEEEIHVDFNKIHNVRQEHICQVLFEMENLADRDWRKESGALLSGERTATPEAAERIWGGAGYRLFLSHKTEVKVEAAALKTRLGSFGISCFVAHEDIEPTKEWQDEIENALASMDAFLALMTDKFHDSWWTDQEVGFAFARGVPMIAARMGRDPYGFIGKFQGLSCNWDTAPNGVIKLLIRHDRMLEAYISTVEKCSSFEHGNVLAQALPHIATLTEEQAERFYTAFNINSELRGSFGFNGTYVRAYGRGLAFHLERMTGQQYIMSPDGIDKR